MPGFVNRDVAAGPSHSIKRVRRAAATALAAIGIHFRRLRLFQRQRPSPGMMPTIMCQVGSTLKNSALVPHISYFTRGHARGRVLTSPLFFFFCALTKGGGQPSLSLTGG